jgi:hypothetical protein
MSEIKVNKISQRSGTAITLGNSGTDFQLPSGADIVAQSGSTITIAAGATITNSGTATGFGATGAVNWDTTKKTTGFTAVSGNGYFCDTTSAAFTVTLPLSPSAGAIVAIADYNGTAFTNNITVGRNSSNINGSAADFTISINYASISFVYVDATAGWRSVDTSNIKDVQNQFVSATGGTITTCGNFKIHTFTGPGTFTVNTTGSGSSTVDYLVIAGGGAGNSYGGGGGGAGGYRTTFPSPGCNAGSFSVTAQAYPITVGAGGASQSSGNPSVFSTITSTAGGKGGVFANGTSGGSGGGGSGIPGGGTGGAGNTPPVSPPQGSNGGNGQYTNCGSWRSGGGGGASAVGANGTPTAAGNGGAGLANSITGSPVTRAGGGGGAAYGPGTQGTGGPGGGGNAANPGVAGTANTGSGGGGGSICAAPSSGLGGSGVVIIRYKFQ